MMTIVYKKNCELKIIQCVAGYEYTDTSHPSERGEEAWLLTVSGGSRLIFSHKEPVSAEVALLYLPNLPLS